MRPIFLASLIILAACPPAIVPTAGGSDTDTDTDADSDTDTDTDADSDTDTDTDTDPPGGCIYTQDFEDSSLFANNTAGSQDFTDGSRYHDETGTSKIGFGSGHGGSGSGLNFYNNDGTTPAQMRLEVPLCALATETVTVNFWAYNPFAAPHTVVVELRRDQLTSVPVTVPEQEWTEFNIDLTAPAHTSEVQFLVGAITQDNSFSFRIDDLSIVAH